MLSPDNISKLDKLMKKYNSPIGTLASKLIKEEINDQNIVKVEVESDLEDESFLNAKDFFRTKKSLKNEKIYHHVGIYCFKPAYLKQYVEFGESKIGEYVDVTISQKGLRQYVHNIDNKTMINIDHDNMISEVAGEDLAASTKSKIAQ